MHKFLSILTLTILFLLSGCSTTKNSVVAATGTSIGLELSQNAATQTPQMKLGYNRAEVAFVSDEKLKDGAGGEDVANVLMELRYGGSSDTHPGIYQRLAIGKKAVTQLGAAAMFSKDANGNISETSLENLEKAINAYDPDNFGEGD